MALMCTYTGLGSYASIAWSLAAIGYGIGLALHRTPLPGGSGTQWGGHLMSYSLVTAGFLAVIGAANSINGIIQMVSGAIGSVPGVTDCRGLPDLYQVVGANAFILLAVLTGIGMGSALIPIIGPAIANIFSVLASLPGLALSFTVITSYTLMTFLTVFGSLAMVLAPLGVALLAVPGGKLKGIGAWLVAAAIVFAAAGPYIPTVGLLACGQGRLDGCSINELTANPENMLSGKAIWDVVTWITNRDNNLIMKYWRFALGSLAGWGIVMAAAAALSKGIGGVAASLGFG